MRTVLVRGALATALLMLVASCSGLLKKIKGEEDDAAADAAVVADAEVAGGDAAEPPPVPAAAALATNEGDVARFPDETKLADVAATTLRPYNVREAPPAGTLVTSLPKGKTVTQIASRDRFFLVVFDNPSAPGSNLMGWVHRDAFSAVVQDAGPLTCPVGEVAIFGDTPFCGKLCAADTECPAGQACKGSGAKLMPNGKPGDNVTVCTVFHAHDAGAPAISDGGVKQIGKKDAGAAPAPTPPPAPEPAADVVAPGAGGACPGNFVFIKKTNKCHRPCTSATAGECKNKPFFCIKCDKEEKKVCGDNRDQCK